MIISRRRFLASAIALAAAPLAKPLIASTPELPVGATQGAPLGTIVSESSLSGSFSFNGISGLNLGDLVNINDGVNYEQVMEVIGVTTTFEGIEGVTQEIQVAPLRPKQTKTTVSSSTGQNGVKWIS